MNVKNFVMSYRSRLFCSSSFPGDGLGGGTENDTARTLETKGSWYCCPDVALGNSHQRT